MKKVDIRKLKLEYKDVPGAGRQVHATIGQKVPCVEFIMRDDIPQPVTWTPQAPFLTFCSPWIQFEPQAWRDMIDEMFTEMVKLWNEKYGTQKRTLTFKEFEKNWWDERKLLADTELGSNGQFDELPYIEWKNLYGDVEFVEIDEEK